MFHLVNLGKLPLEVSRFLPSFLAIPLLFFGSACKDQEEIIPQGNPINLNFKEISLSFSESQTSGIEVILHLDKLAGANSEITLRLQQGELSGRWETTPAISAQNELKIPVTRGARQVSFQINPINDLLYNGNLSLNFKIIQVGSDLKIGTADQIEITLIDDELSGKLKSFETQGMLTQFRSFDYSLYGKINRIVHKNPQASNSEISYTYLYDDKRQLVRINSNPESTNQTFFYEGNVLARTIKQFSTNQVESEEYTFDSENRILGITVRDRNAVAQNPVKSYTEFTYHDNGNVHTITTMEPISNLEYKVIRKITYSDYLEKTNPVPYYQDIPALLIQPHLPGKVIIEEHETTFTYGLTYQFDSSGKVTSRNVSGPSGTEITRYSYY
ncbi:hypothetical protein [Algoriphagus sp. AK58]|uniref:hypothetical protein n=1 Tax=Algoriphagus sp. AK58 TaxID=1406877 RepID=UPI00164FE318|nr:hypothetical protein [Algoriphagus sp. AK58]